MTTRPTVGGSRFPETNREIRGHDFYPPEGILSQIPPLYATEDVPLLDTEVHLHYFAGGMDWYVAELDPESGLAFGWACITDGEWGYFTLPEIEELRIQGLFVIERDLSFGKKRAGDIIRIASTVAPRK
ncbi:DUF2958 domain-containing protein (plasmid) [Streptomyces sp. NBC_01186]|uniref:DUF2958 domain-containing protein n=1 Tax=Streptomyces sp. NBC_01186 TaxID=2903765 RepID=UPI002E143251|nr:DUF2958 domain-containing protein [Streptomyces sp. NBC_01186]